MDSPHDTENDPKKEWPFKEINGHIFRYNRYDHDTQEPIFDSGESCCLCGWYIKFNDKPCNSAYVKMGTVSREGITKKEPVKLKQIDMGEIFNL